MDGQRFDFVMRQLAGGFSRRALYAGIVSGWLALRRRAALAQDRPDDTIDIDDTGHDDIPPCAAYLSSCQAGCCTDGVDCDTDTNTFPGCSRTARLISTFSPDPFGCSR